MHFREWKILYLDWNFTEVCSQESYWQQHSTGSDNGLAPNKQQAIIQTNADLIHWCIYAALGGDEIIDTVSYHYNAVQYNMILHTLLQLLSQNTNQSVNLQKTPHISHNGWAMGCLCEDYKKMTAL